MHIPNSDIVNGGICSHSLPGRACGITGKRHLLCCPYSDGRLAIVPTLETQESENSRIYHGVCPDRSGFLAFCGISLAFVVCS